MVGTASASTTNTASLSIGQTARPRRYGVGTTTKLLKSCGLPTHRPPTSPGETVAHFLEDLDLSQAEAARALGLSANRLNEVVKNKRGISADTALRLAAYFGTTAQFWLNVQGSWDLWRELQRGSKTYGTIFQRRPRAVREAAVPPA
ncbi:MAG: addiction module antidote protein, HigA family [Acidobacteria bacterium]|nr:MAG: addiction module antidote protein, HigA family [Acidobacteriota bacterium]